MPKAPLPAVILRRRGSKRATARARAEPKAPPGIPRCPQWLSSDARKVWKELIPMLQALEVLSWVDRGVIVRYCVTYARWRAAEKEIQEKGSQYETIDGNGNLQWSAYPVVREAANLQVELRSLETKLGISPGDRARIAAARTKEEPKKDAQDPTRFIKRA